MKKIILFILLVCFSFMEAFASLETPSTQGSKFFFGFMPASSKDKRLVLTVSSPSAGVAKFTSSTGVTTTQTINAGITEIFLATITGEKTIASGSPYGDCYTTDPNVINQKGYMVETFLTDGKTPLKVSMYAGLSHKSSSDCANIYPLEAISNEYYVISRSGNSVGNRFLQNSNQYNSAYYPSEMLIVGADTTAAGVDIDVYPTCLINGQTATDDIYPVIHIKGLKKGETYLIQALSSDSLRKGEDDLTGTRVVAVNDSNLSGNKCKKFAVFSGSMHGSGVNSPYNNGDYEYDQLFPVSLWGTDYITGSTTKGQKDSIMSNGLMYSKRAGRDEIRVVASQPCTQVYINNKYVTTLNQGEFYSHRDTTDVGTFVHTTKPVEVGLFTTGEDELYEDDPADGGPALIILAPMQQYLREITFAAYKAAYDSKGSTNVTQHSLMITSLTSIREQTTLNGVALTNGSTLSLNGQKITWTTIPSNPKYSQLIIVPLNKTLAYTLKNTAPEDSIGGFTAIVYGSEGKNAGYGYSVGASAASITTSFNLSNGTETYNSKNLSKEICIGTQIEVDPEIPSGTNITSVEWDFDGDDVTDTTTYSTNNFSATYQYKSPGTYTARMIVFKTADCFTDTANVSLTDTIYATFRVKRDSVGATTDTILYRGQTLKEQLNSETLDLRNGKKYRYVDNNNNVYTDADDNQYVDKISDANLNSLGLSVKDSVSTPRSSLKYSWHTYSVLANKLYKYKTDTTTFVTKNEYSGDPIDSTMVLKDSSIVVNPAYYSVTSPVDSQLIQTGTPGLDSTIASIKTVIKNGVSVQDTTYNYYTKYTPRLLKYTIDAVTKKVSIEPMEYGDTAVYWLESESLKDKCTVFIDTFRVIMKMDTKSTQKSDTICKYDTIFAKVHTLQLDPKNLFEYVWKTYTKTPTYKSKYTINVKETMADFVERAETTTPPIERKDSVISTTTGNTKLVIDSIKTVNGKIDTIYRTLINPPLKKYQTVNNVTTLVDLDYGDTATYWVEKWSAKDSSVTYVDTIHVKIKPIVERIKTYNPICYGDTLPKISSDSIDYYFPDLVGRTVTYKWYKPQLDSIGNQAEITLDENHGINWGDNLKIWRQSIGGCMYVDTFSINIPKKITNSITASASKVCGNGETPVTVTATQDGDATSTKFEMSDNGISYQTVAFTGMSYTYNPTTYKIFKITSSGVCQNDTAAYPSVVSEVPVETNPPFTAELEATSADFVTPNVLPLSGGNVTLNVSEDISNSYTYKWYPKEITATTSQYIDNVTSDQSYLVVVSDPDNLCTDTTNTVTITLRKIQLHTLLLPKSDNPLNLTFAEYDDNGDPLTNTFTYGYTITIFNRYGQKIFDKKDGGWDGTYKGKIADAGVYFYVLEYLNSENQTKSIKGTIEIVK